MRGTASRCVARYQRTALRYVRRRFSPCRGRFWLECADDVAQHRQHMLHECSAAMLPASALSASITPFAQVSTLSLGCAAAAANLHRRRNLAVGVLELPTGRSSTRCVPYTRDVFRRRRAHAQLLHGRRLLWCSVPQPDIVRAGAGVPPARVVPTPHRNRNGSASCEWSLIQTPRDPF